MRVFRSVRELTSKLVAIKERGFIPTRRKGDTGVGYTLEWEIGLEESNLQLGDFGLHELKAVRARSTSLVTLFTFNRGAWKIGLGDVIRKYGYADQKLKRRALYITATRTANSRGLSLRTRGGSLQLISSDGALLGEWGFNSIAAVFAQKMNQLILVKAESRFGPEGKEEFWYRDAYRLSGCNVLEFPGLVSDGTIVLDIRAHLRPGGAVRNHGTGFRVREQRLDSCYSERVKLV